MNKAINIGAGMMLGALVGAGLVLLLAPQSGADTRQAIQDRIQAILDEGKESYETRRLELTTQFEDLKRPESVEVTVVEFEQ
jgi:gas vesicle protein